MTERSRNTLRILRAKLLSEARTLRQNAAVSATCGDHEEAEAIFATADGLNREADAITDALESENQ